ncbi:thiamine pyrophosphate-binding protein [Bradyrhizobium liaoningense]|uniref:thiamine pyrophosphate-binding protein n=1 Tax=Bradyrhizobium liaoningense TaxID=43992 RepID=UPI001BA84B7C|nr:thiamine pyrophosphate-binding protein [Bradyrhizobium liaoningense]MBR1033214.1 alpha-keto acid decarboxylase family protein [Bradyrhizobium liaoningense]
MTETVADYVVGRLRQHGVEVLFGIPGTSCAAVFDSASAQGLTTVVNSSELDAGYAADGYARMRGLSAVSVSYGVGTLSLVNAVAGALVERSAVVVVNGGPGIRDLWKERRYGVLFSHSTGRPLTDLAMFKEVTAFAARVERAEDAPRIVDEAIAIAMREQRPVYIEVPNDLWLVPCPSAEGALDVSRPASGKEAELADEIVQLMSRASRPAVLFCAEIARYGLAEEAKRLVAGSGIPWATTLLGKTVLPETTPGFVGVYDSDLAPKPVRQLLEESDCLLALGCVFGVDHGKLVTTRYAEMLSVADGWARIGDQVPQRAEIGTLLPLLGSRLGQRATAVAQRIDSNASFASRRQWAREPAVQELTHEQLYRVVDRHLDEDWVVVHDTCLGSYPAADLNVKGCNAFICCPVWLSIGHSIGAAIGVGVADARRPLVICGDGGFQIVAAGLSAMARHGIRAVVIVIDNGLYAIEQYLIDPKWFTDPDREPLPYVGLQRWDYPGLARAMGFGNAVSVATEADLDKALGNARAWGGPGLISARVSPRDLPPENQ